MILNLENVVRVEAPGTMETKWFFALIRTSRNDAICQLGSPHYVEKDGYRTAGGLEDHWVFQVGSMVRIGFVFLHSYGELRIVADQQDVQLVQNVLSQLAFECAPQWLQSPILIH